MYALGKVLSRFINFLTVISGLAIALMMLHITLDVIARHPERYTVFALTAATQVEVILAQCQRFAPRYAVMASAPHAQQLAARVRELGLAVEVLPPLDDFPDALFTEDVALTFPEGAILLRPGAPSRAG